MSPIPTVYNHFNSQMSIPTSRSNCENLNLLTKPESDNQQISNRRYTVTNLSNHCQMPSSASAMDFRPLITNGRKKLGPIPSSSSMIIIKKKSPPRFNSSIEVRTYFENKDLFNISISFIETNCSFDSTRSNEQTYII